MAVSAIRGPGVKLRGASGVLTVMMIGLIVVLVIPLPTFVLDLLITLNVCGSLLILMATLGANKPLDFSTFPSVILFTALLRLALNVASTRLILLQGDAGSVIRAFGEFVVGGSYVVGVVIFLILVVIQFVVITKGQNRIAEVAARFTLDALPGKQMAIDADLNAGVISNEEAKAKRTEIARESEFYGAMDGAGKFIRGDAVAGLIITVINIVGGIVLGVVLRNMSPTQALESYTVLTVGDGLVSQIPGLLVSVASGILVTKAASKKDLGDEMVDQLFGSKSGVRIAGLTVLSLGLVPGLPTLPFSLLGGGLLLVSLRKQRSDEQERSEADAEAAVAEPSEEDRIRDLLHVDRLGIDIGYRLISIVDPGRHGGLLEHIAQMRRQYASSLGIVLPPVRVKDDVNLGPNEYVIQLMGHEVARSELRAGQYLAIDPSGTAEPIEGVEASEPAFGMPARWITEGQKEQAEIRGYTVIEAPSVLVTHLGEIVKRFAHELISREDVQALIDNVKKSSPTTVDDLVPNLLTTPQLHRVLGTLLQERVPIRNMPRILETLSEVAAESKDMGRLVEAVRLALARAICEPLRDPEGKLHVVTIDGPLEARLLGAITHGGTDTLPDGMLGRFVESAASMLAELVKQGKSPVLVTRAGLRPFFSEAVGGAIPGAAVLAYPEVASEDLVVVGQVQIDGVAA